MSENQTPRSYPVTYVSEFTQKAIAGANFKTKKAGRPFIFCVREFMIQTKEGGTVVNPYLLFGGVPSPKLHEALDTVGFKVRRRPRTWNDKSGKAVDIATRDNECYAVYYSTHEELTADQINLIGKIFLLVNGTKKTGKSFLSSSWAAVEEKWGTVNEWLTHCAVDTTTSAPAAAPVENSIVAALSDLEDELI